MIRTKIKPQAAAFKIWRELGHIHPNEVEIEDLAMARGVLVLPGGISGTTGRLTRKGDNGIIRYNENIKQEGRKRFTIAHELGHWELHEAESQFLVCNEQDMRDYGNSPMEKEANLFASELLMPSKHFRSSATALKPSIQTIHELAKEFNTTMTATAIRLAETSQKSLQIVLSEKGYIKWCYVKDKSSTPRIRRQQLPKYCSANLPPSEVANYMDHYDEAQWFEDNGNDYEVMEQSLHMPSYDACLTLIEIN